MYHLNSYSPSFLWQDQGWWWGGGGALNYASPEVLRPVVINGRSWGWGALTLWGGGGTDSLEEVYMRHLRVTSPLQQIHIYIYIFMDTYCF